MNIDYIFASIAILTLVALTIFQLLLIVGRPYGRLAWGGRYEVLPNRLRVSSLVSIILYVLIGIVIVSHAQLAPIIDSTTNLTYSMWFLTAYFTLGVVMNLASRSRPERLVMTPVALILAVSCLVLAL
jgi:uncharacterized membrane protein SirB2